MRTAETEEERALRKEKLLASIPERRAKLQERKRKRPHYAVQGVCEALTVQFAALCCRRWYYLREILLAAAPHADAASRRMLTACCAAIRRHVSAQPPLLHPLCVCRGLRMRSRRAPCRDRVIVTVWLSATARKGRRQHATGCCQNRPGHSSGWVS